MRKLIPAAMLLVCFFTSFHLSAQAPDPKTLLTLVKQNAPRLGLTDTDVDDALVSSAYTDRNTGIQYLYLQQAYQNIPVYTGIKTIIFRNSEVLYSSGNFLMGFRAKASNAQPSISAADAIVAAAIHLGLDRPSGLSIIEEKTANKKIIFNTGAIAKQNIEASLCWVITQVGEVKLAWNVNIDVLHSSDWWNVRVDASAGSILEKDNWTVNETHVNAQGSDPKTSVSDFRFYNPPPNVTSADYFVIPFPYESPKHHAFAVESQPWLKAGAGNAAITNGWHFDGTNNYSITRGNNVFAYLDIQNSNAAGGTGNFPDTSSTSAPGLSFLNGPSFTQQPSLGVNRKSAVTNLFYWNNIIHDITYQYGFNEVSGNFQTDNLGRGGSGNDYVQAEAQDASGTNNANFSTPSDGGRPRMQMYLWTGSPAVVVTAPGSIAGTYSAPESAFSTANKLANIGAVSGSVVYYNDATGGLHEGCVTPSNNLLGKIVLIDRGNCNFTIKVKNAQNAGAIAAIVINNVGGAAGVMSGTDNTITIPAVMISQADGALLLSQISNGLTVTLSPAIGIDGDFDNSVVVHEFGHGVSNRLTGGPANASCLSNAEQGGEGWSDYLALMTTTNWATTGVGDGPLAHPMGNYATNQPVTGDGIRTYPYSTNMTINPLTYSYMASNAEVHFIGEIWCAALWDMTWNIIQQTNSIEPNIYNSNSNAGNVIALKLVMEGMRLQPCRPGFLDARDAILAADSILYNGIHTCSIWKAFARRGMGLSAKQGSSSSATDQTAAFDVPSAVYLSKSATPSVIAPTSQQVITVTANCQCAIPANGYTIRDTIPTGFSYVSSTGGTLSGNVVTFSGINFSTVQEAKTFSVTLKPLSSGCFIDTAINDNRTSTIGGFTSAAITGTTQWLPSTGRYKSPGTAWLGATPTAASDLTLTSGSFTPGNLAVLSFWHYYMTEATFDGGTVELSTNGGTQWFDAGPYIVQNGYNSVMDPNAPWTANQSAFSGSSYGQGNGGFVNTILNLSSFNGQSVKMRFRMRTDAGNPGIMEGWYIDDILEMNGCGGIVKAGLYNSGGVKIDSSVYPIFIKSTGIPVTIQNHPAAVTVCPGGNASFSVTASGGTLTYQWQLSTNGGTSYTNIVGATNSGITITGVTSAMNTYLYRVIVDNGANSVTSTPALLTVGTPTAVNAIANVSACEGSTSVFTSNATGTNLNYSWQVSTDGGANFTTIAGATSPTLTLTNVSSAQNNNRYRVFVAGMCGSATSGAGTLTVNAAPSAAITALPATICRSAAALTLSATPAGGTWSGQGVQGNIFNPATLVAGSYQLTYSVSNTQGCTTVTSASIAVQNCADRLLPLSAAGSIVLYSNPNDGRFTLRFKTERYTKLHMQIVASDGRLMKDQTINGITFGMEQKVNMYNAATGVYTLTLHDDATGDDASFKFTIQRK